MNEDFFVQLELIERSYKRALDPTNARLIVEAAQARSPYNRSPAQVTAAVNRITPLLVEGATAALAKYKKHIPAAILMLKWRRLYDPRVKPKKFARPDGESTTIDMLCAFFGCEPQEATGSLQDEWDVYCDSWDTISLDEKLKPMRAFWVERKVGV